MVVIFVNCLKSKKDKGEKMKYVLRNDYMIRVMKENVFLENIYGERYKISKELAFFYYLFYIPNEIDEIEKNANKILKNQKINIRRKLFENGNFILPDNINKNISGYNERKFNYRELIMVRSGQVKERQKFPKYITLRLTNMCRKKCIYCYAEKRNVQELEQDKLVIEDYERIIDEAFRIGSKGFLLTGGEPAEHPNFYDIINKILEKNMEVSVVTKNIIEFGKIKKPVNNILNIQFSLDEIDEEKADKIVGKKGYFKDILENMNNANKLCLPYSIDITVSKMNCNNIENIVKFMYKKGASYVFLNRFEKIENETINKKCYIDNREWEILCKKIKKMNNPNTRIKEYDGYKNEREGCTASRTRICIDYNGDFLACEKLDKKIVFGNTKKDSIFKIWNNDNYIKYCEEGNMKCKCLK